LVWLIALLRAPARGILRGEHVRKGVIEVKHQPVTHPAGNPGLQRIVIGNTAGCNSGDAMKFGIRAESSVVRCQLAFRNLVQVCEPRKVVSVAPDIADLDKHVSGDSSLD